jgi:hypothetical protein
MGRLKWREMSLYYIDAIAWSSHGLKGSALIFNGRLRKTENWPLPSLPARKNVHSAEAARVFARYSSGLAHK